MARNPQVDDRLGDYTADARIIPLTLIAAAVGVMSAFVALALPTHRTIHHFLTR